MKIAVLSSADSWYFNDLQAAAGSRHQVTAIPFTRIGTEIGGVPKVWTADAVLDSCDAVIVRTMPPGSLEQVVFRMNVLAQLAAAGVHVLNPPRSIEVAVDKFLAAARLEQAGLLTPRSIVCQTVDDAMSGFTRLGRDVVVKPVFGSEGRGMIRISDEEIAWRVFKSLVQIGAVIFQQQFIHHKGFDIRLLVLGQRVFAIKRVSQNDWRTNISRGARAEPFQADDPMVEIARRAADCVGAPFAGVDLLPSRDGPQYVLEVNAVPGWRSLSHTLQVNIAAELLRFLEKC